MGEIVSHQDGRWKTKLIGTMMDWPPQAIFPGTHHFIFTAKVHLCLLFKPSTNIHFTCEECFYQHTWTGWNGINGGIQIQKPSFMWGNQEILPWSWFGLCKLWLTCYEASQDDLSLGHTGLPTHPRRGNPQGCQQLQNILVVWLVDGGVTNQHKVHAWGNSWGQHWIASVQRP